jgi:hypothetical protein
MRESRTSGFVRGVHSNMCPYRDPYLCHIGDDWRQVLPEESWCSQSR